MEEVFSHTHTHIHLTTIRTKKKEKEEITGKEEEKTNPSARIVD
mgnify:FL=1